MVKLRGLVAASMLLLLAPLGGGPALAQEALSPRLQIGINLLPAVIAANNGIAKIDADQKLSIYLVYRENQFLAEQLKQNLSRIGLIREHPLDIQTLALDQLLAGQLPPMSTIFIAEPIDSRLQDLIDLTRQQRVLLFSPIKGDVERGIATGFRVTDKVLPLVNIESLKQSKIQLKAFFLRIAVKHEQ